MRQSGEAPLKYCLLSPDLKYFDKHWEPKKNFFLENHLFADLVSN